MSNINWGIIVWMVVIGLVCGTIGYVIAPEKTTGLSETEINAKISDAVEQATAVKDAEIETLKELIENKTTEEDEEEIIVFEGYLLDKLLLSEPFVEGNFSDREVSTLFDGEVDFDGDDYDAWETFTLKEITLLANENDFEGNVYMTIPSGAIEYKFEFDSDLNTSLIDEDETLVFNFLGENYEISDWDETEITLTKGTEHRINVGKSITIENKIITLEALSEDKKVSVIVNDETEVIKEGKTKTINGIEIKVDTIFYPHYAILIVGDEIETILESGDEYEEDSIWEWKISANSIGLVLIEDFTEIDKDGDEEFPAIAEGEKLCLPNDYVCIGFNGMAEEETEEYLFDLHVDYVRVKGDFYEGYDRVYIDRITGLIYEDDDLESIIEGVVELGDSDLVMLSDGIGIEIKNSVSGDRLFYVNLDLKTVFVDRDDEDFTSMDENWNNITSEDEDYLTNYGILVINPEDSCEDQEFNVFVPEEKLEGSITLI